MSNSFFSSSISEQRWVNQFDEHFIIYIDSQPSIFRVPKNVVDTKPEAYAPQQIGLGAYHHFRPELDDEMESKKLEAIKKFLEPDQFNKFKSLIVDEMKELEQSIRACYNNYLDFDGDTLAWIMAIDGTYLLYLLTTINSSNRNLAVEILKLENQIPSIVLKRIKKALQHQDDGDKLDGKLFSNIHNFCKAPSPFDLCSDAETVGDDARNTHLLGYLHHLIMNNWIVPDFIFSPQKSRKDQSGSAVQYMSLGNNENQPLDSPQSTTTVTGITTPLINTDEETEQLVQEAANLLGNLTGLKPLKLLAKLPLKEGTELYKLFNNAVKTDNVEEIEIPSVSQLHEIVKLDFRKWTENGIGIKYKERERLLYLPVMKLNTDSEVILRNLKAYEEASASQDSNMKFSEYLDFMCGIIDTAKDVELLKDRGIIESEMSNEDIAQLFNGINKSNGYNVKKLADLEQTIERLNISYDDTFMIKVWRYVKQHFSPSENCIKIVLYILVVLLLTLQAFCQVYGCSARWFGNISSTN